MKHLQVNPHNYQWIFNPSRRCKRDQTRFLVLIKSKEENYQVRHTIRDTWCTREDIQYIADMRRIGPIVPKNIVYIL